MTRPLLCLGLLLGALAGCASEPPPPPPEPIHFAVLGAPSISAEPVELEGEELYPEELLLEAATQLSLQEPAVRWCLVPGPLLDASLEEESREDAILALSGALGSISLPIVSCRRTQQQAR